MTVNCYNAANVICNDDFAVTVNPVRLCDTI